MSKDETSRSWEGRRIDFAQFATALSERRDLLADDLVIPHNAGNRRTESKRALLAAIEATGKDW